MNDLDWREKTIDKLRVLLENQPEVKSLSVFGSLANPNIQADRWSDLDLLLVVEDNAVEKYFPTSDWLKTLGSFFAVQQSSTKENDTTKIIFDDFRKIDLIITSYTQVLKNKPFWSKQKVVFSKSDEISQTLIKTNVNQKSLDLNKYNLEKVSNDFWFLAHTAVTKVMRNDLLIALHLSLDLFKYCLLINMWLRDREKGTNIHRIGKNTKRLIENMDIRLDSFSKKDILNFIGKCGHEFEKLASKWSPKHKSRAPEFNSFLDSALKEA